MENSEVRSGVLQLYKKGNGFRWEGSVEIHKEAYQQHEVLKEGAGM